MTTKLLRTLMGMVALVAMLTACSSEDVLLDEPNAKNEITFNVTTNHASRALTNITQATQVTKFHLAAWVRNPDVVPAFGSPIESNNVYISNDVIVRNSDGTYTNQGDIRYWPQNPSTEVLDFFAWEYGNGKEGSFTEKDEDGVILNTFVTEPTFDWKQTSTRPSLRKVVQAVNSNLQVDLLYAYAQGRVGFTSTEKKTSEKVDLQFHHAMAKVGIAAKCENSNLHIEIAEIGLMNICKEANFCFPLASLNDGEIKTTPAKWSCENLASAHQTDVKADVNPQTGGKKFVSLEKSTGTVNLVTGDNSFMVIPFDYGSVENAKFSATNFNLTTTQYIRVKCRIWNIADSKNWQDSYGGEGTKAPDLLIWGESNNGEYGFKDLYIPIVFNWDMNKSYLYTITFGTGNAGYDENGDPSLVIVNYEPTLEDWITEENPQNDISVIEPAQ